MNCTTRFASLKASSALALLICLLVTSIQPAHAAQWKWRDADGRIQYSDRPPPPGVSDKDILKRPPAMLAPAPAKASDTASAATAAAKPLLKASDPELEAKRRKQESEQEAQKKAEADKLAKTRADNCQRARNYQKALGDGIRISRTNDKGEREVLDDKARAAEQARARESIESNCR